MSNLSFLVPQSEKSRLLVTAVAASIFTLGAVSAYRTVSQRQRRKELERDVLRSIKASSSVIGSQIPLPEEFTADSTQINVPQAIQQFDEALIREHLARNYAFFGEEGMEKVRNGSVVIVGCGGVGSWAATMLVRSGVSRIRLIDFDYVTLSSLNRHAVATLEDVGTPKVFACQKYFKKVAPWVQVDAQVELWKDGEEGMNLLDGNIDWVVDAIDNITTKVQLLRACHQRGIKVFASMGAGAKTDPTRVQISDISNTYEDPLARSVRRRLRLEGVSSGIPVVYSTEIPGQVKLLPLAEEEFKKGAVHELGAFDDFRVRILPVLGPLPAVFGLHIATYILCEIAGKPIANPLATRNRKKLYEKLYKELGAREARLAGDPQQKRLPISETDVEYIFEDLHRGRSTIPPHAVLAKPVLARWDIREPLEKDGNIVVLSADDAQKLEAGGGIGERVWGDDVVDLVRRRAREAADVRKWNC